MATTWNPADKAAGITLSSGNLIATGSAGNNSVRATTSKSTGQWYLEYSAILEGGASGCLGFAHAAQSLTTNTMDVPGTFGIYPNGTPTGNLGGSMAMGTVAGNVVGIAVDLTNNLAWFRYGATGNWNGSPTANPATGVGGASTIGTSSPNGAVFPFTFLQNTPSTTTLNTGASAFTGAVPAGFTAWDSVPVPTNIFGTVIC